MRFDNDDANVLATGHPVEFSKVWDGTCYSPAVRGGLGVEYALSERVALGLEANVNMLPDKWNSKRGTDADWQNHLLLGIKIALGKTTQRTIVEPAAIIEPVVEPVVEPGPEPVVEEQPIVSQPVEEAPKTAAVAEEDSRRGTACGREEGRGENLLRLQLLAHLEAGGRQVAPSGQLHAQPPRRAADH